MAVEIVPAIIAKNFEELKRKIKLVEPYVDWVQLDVMDGKFVPEKTWPYFALLVEKENRSVDSHLGGNNDSSIGYLPERLKTNLNLEAHLMIEEPEKEIDKWLDSGVKRILVHWEALKGDLRFTIYDLRRKIDEKGIEFGIVLNIETPVEVLNKLQFSLKQNKFATEQASFKFQVIQLMSIAKIGYHGELFDEKVIPRIRSLKKMYPNVKIAVDGGINLQTAPLAVAAGADILAVGSAIFNSKNIEQDIKQLKEIYVQHS